MTLLKRLYRWTRRLFKRTQTIPNIDLTEATRTAKLFYIVRLFQRLKDHPVRFIRQVDRPPHFTVKKGSKGIVVGSCYDPDDAMLIIRVALDDALAGAEEFGGEVHWKEGINLEDFEKDVVLVLR